MVKRKISVDKYFIAAFLTILIFSLGLALGFLIDNARLNWAKQITEEQEIDFSSLQLQFLYLNSIENINASCEVLKVTLDQTIKDLSDSLDKFQQYKKDTKINKEQFELVSRRYILDNLRYWLFARKSKDACNIKLVTILYFYSEEHCEICPDQGVILSYYKKIFEEKLLIFPINVDLESKESMITILKNIYNVKDYPSIVIEDEKYEGVVDKIKLGALICDAFNDNTICER